jgi:hypothetical protein
MNLLKTSLLAVLISSSMAYGNEIYAPKHKPGQCLQDYRFHEPWRAEPPIFLIVRSGNRHYLMTSWDSTTKKYEGQFEESFWVVDEFKLTPCPVARLDANPPQR